MPINYIYLQEIELCNRHNVYSS